VEVLGREIHRILAARVHRAREVGRTAEQFRELRSEHVERDLRRGARRLGARDRGTRGQRFLGDLRPVLRQLTFHAALELGTGCGMFALVALEDAGPLLLGRGARFLVIPGGADFGGNLERRVFPAERLARQRHFIGTERLAVRRLRALFVGRAPADDGLADDQRRLILLRARLLDRGGHRVGVMAIDVLHDVPAVRLEALGGVVREPTRDLAVDRDAVVVVENGELAELQGAGERTGFVRDAFHEAAVAGEAVRVVVDERQAVLVVLRR